MESETNAIRAVVMEYLEGMIYGQDDLLRKVMHPLCMQAGHYNGQYEFFPREVFMASLQSESRERPGTPIVHEIQTIDITGDTAMVKVTDDCFGTRWTDYLTLIKHEGEWQIVMKAFFNHAEGKV